MTEDELVAKLIAHIGNVELSLLAAYLGIEADVQQHVAQLLLYIERIILHERITQLEGLLYGIWAQALIGLLAVPRAFLTQVVQHIQQSSEGCQLLFSCMHFHLQRGFLYIFIYTRA